jgi:hypothetical protein
MNRPAIPAEIKRKVLVEAGHRCVIPHCASAEIDVHHIIPWETCQDHSPDNLIALCPNCHRRAHKGEIDRKSSSFTNSGDSGFFEGSLETLLARWIPGALGPFTKIDMIR